MWTIVIYLRKETMRGILACFVLNPQISAFGDSGCGMSNQVADGLEFNAQGLHY